MKELNYFPPKGTKYIWSCKALNYSWWRCDLSKQKAKSKDICFYFPMYIYLNVDLIDGNYIWKVEVRNWEYEVSYKSGVTGSALEACLAAERYGECEFKKLTPNWIVNALKNKWRPPALQINENI